MTDTKTPRQARFLTGSIMRHVVVMTSAGMIGLTFMFLVDAITLFWVSKLDQEALIAAMGFAWTIQYFTISVGVAFMIAASALVARSMGQENWDIARRQATASMVITVGVLCVGVAFLLFYRRDILMMVGAEGAVLDHASNFLLISVPTLPVMAIGMIGSAILRAEGDALRSMAGTMSAGFAALIFDPLFIFGFDMGIEGAALGISVSRILSAMLTMFFVIKVKDLMAWFSWADVKQFAKPFLIIAVPTVLTQMSSPVGNLIATRAISEFGDSAVAGWAVLGRILVVAFGGVYALSGAIGGIVGQNFGAHKFDRVRDTYRDSLIFSTVYVLVAWALMAALTPMIISIYSLSHGAAEVVQAFTYVAAAAFAFVGALYVSNACFNNLGRPLYSTGFNWIKDGIFMYPLCIWGGMYMGATGVIYGQALAGVFGGLFAALFGWRFISQVEERTKTSTSRVLKEA